MKRFVVDASIAIQWYLPEDYSEYAERLLSPEIELLIPDLLFSELANIVWKQVIRHDYARQKASTILETLEAVPFQIWSAKSLMSHAFAIACLTKRTFYDSLYVALAENTACKMVTADRKLFNSLEGSRYHKYLLWVEDIP
ncbi:MAG: type II toxin-antitoxin system VapC family toxin [Thermodesulfovibrionales bacterium]